MSNPLIDQGNLTRLKASIVFNSFPSLNVTSPYLGKEMIHIRMTGKSSTPIETATGVVQSPEPYILVEIMAHLLKTQSLSDAFKTQQETLVLLGDITVRPDVSVGLGAFQFANVAIQSVDELSFAGTNAEFTVTMSGIYYINSSLWN